MRCRVRPCRWIYRTAAGRTGASFFDPLMSQRIAFNSICWRPIIPNRTSSRDEPSPGAIRRSRRRWQIWRKRRRCRTALNGYWDSVVATIGMRSMETIEVTETRTLLVNPLEHQRPSVMRVSLDEKLANMISYQSACEAAAGVITTMDEAIDTVISGAGTVGRWSSEVPGRVPCSF